MVAAARLRKAQERMNEARPYTAKIREIVTKLIKKSDSSNPLLRSNQESGKVLVMVMGSDRGLCGGFNTNLFRIVERKIRDDFAEHLEEGSLALVCFGKKPYDYFQKRKYPIIDHKIGFFDHLKYEQVGKVIREVMDDFRDGKYREVHLAYNEFKSVIAQSRRFEQILPLNAEKLNGADLVGKDDKKSGGSDVKKDLSDIDYLYEPDSDTILNHVLPLLVTIRLWQASLESYAAEQGARMTAMDSATENAGEIINDLQLKYNQARQAAITTELSEIVSGAEALSK